MNDCLGVGVGFELMAALDERFTQFGKIVDFTIEDNPDRSVLVANRLMAARHINDRKPPHTKSDIVLEIESLVVRAAMNDCASHFAGDLLVGDLTSVEIDESCNTAHKTLESDE